MYKGTRHTGTKNATKIASKPHNIHSTSKHNIKTTHKRTITSVSSLSHHNKSKLSRQQSRLLSTQSSNDTPRILITGSVGQVGSDLSRALREKYGVDNVLATDIRDPTPDYPAGPFARLDVMDKDAMDKMIVDHRATWIIHLASILSAVGEKKPHLAMTLNTRSIENVLDLAVKHKLRVFAPSTIAAFGPSTPPDMTPNTTIMRPTTMYGLTKVYLELLGDYYKNKFGVDFRSLRYPGVISSSAPGGGGTTDYAVDIFHSALTTGQFTCFLHKDSALPMMYTTDCLKATMDILVADPTKLMNTTYNVTGTSFTPHQLDVAIRKWIPHFKMSYNHTPPSSDGIYTGTDGPASAPGIIPPGVDFRQGIADSWPNSLDDTCAKNEWNWSPEYTSVDTIAAQMIYDLRAHYVQPANGHVLDVAGLEKVLKDNAQAAYLKSINGNNTAAAQAFKYTLEQTTGPSSSEVEDSLASTFRTAAVTM